MANEAREAHRAYLRERLRKLDNTYHGSWPRWTYRDMIAVSDLLLAEPVPAPPPPALPPCADCGKRPAQYTSAGLDITVPGHGVCRLCLYNQSGESPDDRAEHDATSEAEYETLRQRYIGELLTETDPTALPLLLAYYADHGYTWALALLGRPMRTPLASRTPPA